MLTDYIFQLENLTAPRADVKTPSGVIGKPSACGALFFTMEKVCGIYKITSPKKKVYIGQSIDILKRFRTYRTLSCISQTFLYNSLKKYGVGKHKFEILQQCEVGELNKLEKYYVDLFQCFNSKYGLNLRDGGGRETKMRNRTEETRLKLSESHKGQVAHNKGKPMSNEQYQKCFKTMFKVGCVGIRKGTKLTEDHKEKLRKAHTGKKLTKEHKQNISSKLKGRPSKLKGTKRPTKLIEKYKELSKYRIRNKYGQYV